MTEAQFDDLVDFLRKHLPEKRADAVTRAVAIMRGIAEAVSRAVPSACLSEDGQGVFVCWDHGEHHFEVELEDDAALPDWFYRNRRQKRLLDSGEFGPFIEFPCDRPDTSPGPVAGGSGAGP